MARLDRPLEELVVRELYRHRQSIFDFRTFYGKDVFEYKGITFAAHELDLAPLDLLSPKQREAWVLAVLEDLPIGETAEVMGVSNVTAGQYVDHAARKLARYHFPGYDDEGRGSAD